jgi:hypothetical protein
MKGQREGGEKGMDRVFRMLGFWTGIFTVMFYVGDMMVPSVLSLIQTVFFLTLGYLRLSERMYMYLFGAYLTVFAVGYTWYSEFILVPGFG